MSLRTELTSRSLILNDWEFMYAGGVRNSAHQIVRPAPPVIEGLPRPLPLVTYSPDAPYSPAAWILHAGNLDLNEGGSKWRYSGGRPFLLFGTTGMNHHQQKNEALQNALAWCEERWGIDTLHGWAKTPFGAYAPAAFVVARTAQLKQLLKTLPPVTA